MSAPDGFVDTDEVDYPTRRCKQRKRNQGWEMHSHEKLGDVVVPTEAVTLNDARY